MTTASVLDVQDFGDDDVRGCRLLVLDDDPDGVALLRRVLTRAGYVDVAGFTDAGAALADLARNPADLLLLDMRMPLSGLEVLALLGERGLDVPVVCLTADGDAALRRQALQRGVADFLTKPYEPGEVLLRVRNILRVGRLRLQLVAANRDLEQRVKQRTAELVEARNEVLARLCLAAEFRDDDTHEHTVRVGTYAALVARSLGQHEDWVEQLRQVAPLHDLGKIGVPDAVLLKPARLTPAEFDVVKRHTVIGSQILEGGRSTLMQLAEEVARTHHEKWDGSGYLGMTGTEIPLSGRIVAVADVFDALTHARPYKVAWPVDRARDQVQLLRGSHFDPVVADAFLMLLDGGHL